MNTTGKILLTIAAVTAITIAFGVSAVRAGPSFELNIGPKGFDLGLIKTISIGKDIVVEKFVIVEQEDIVHIGEKNIGIFVTDGI